MGIPLTEINLRVTYYSRVSTDNIEQKSSLDNQTTFFENLIKNNKNWIYIPGYIEQGISGTTDYKREKFLNMINDAKNNKFDLIITKEISRFSRNTLDSIKYTRELSSYGVAVLFLNDNINTLLPDSELRLTIMASLAQDEIRRLSERVKFGMKRAVEKGVILGNNQLYGYKKNKQTGKLIINKKEAIIVKRLYNLYAIKKISLSKISKIFNEEKIPTNQNKKWSITTLSRMIKNPKYKGYYCGRKTEVIDYIHKTIKYHPKSSWITYIDKEKIPSIVSEELWNIANDHINKNKRINTKNKYLLSNKIICLNDNHTFHRRVQCKTTNDITWLCSKYLKEGKKYCKSPNIRESEITHILKDLINILYININEPINLLNKYYNDSSLMNILQSYEQIIIEKIYDIIINKITTKLINNSIELNIYLNAPKHTIYKKEYIFKRGYNTKGTKRYEVKYSINYFFEKDKNNGY